MLNIQYLGFEKAENMHFSGNFLNFGKSAGVKDLTNIMSDFEDATFEFTGLA